MVLSARGLLSSRGLMKRRKRLIVPQVSAASGVKAVDTSVSGFDYDGADGYELASPTGESDSGKGLISFWFRPDGGDDTTLYIFNSQDNRLQFYRNTANAFQFNIRNTSGATRFRLTSGDITGDDITVANGWRHVMVSWDNSTSVDANHLYVDGEDDVNVLTFVNDETLDWTGPKSCGSNYGGTDFMDGVLAQVYINPGTYMDLSVAANREKFYNNGEVYLGSDGSTPTGTAPLYYFPNGDPTNNAGSGSNFALADGDGGDVVAGPSG